MLLGNAVGVGAGKANACARRDDGLDAPRRDDGDVDHDWLAVVVKVVMLTEARHEGEDVQRVWSLPSGDAGRPSGGVSWRFSVRRRRR